MVERPAYPPNGAWKQASLESLLICLKLSTCCETRQGYVGIQVMNQKRKNNHLSPHRLVVDHFPTLLVLRMTGTIAMTITPVSVLHHCIVYLQSQSRAS